MTFGVRVWDSAGVMTFDSDTAIIGICIGVYRYVAGATATLTFPDLAGRTVKTRTLQGARVPSNETVDYALGYPRINVPTGTGTRAFSAWAQ